MPISFAEKQLKSQSILTQYSRASVSTLCETVDESRRKFFWAVVLPKLIENHEFRMKINEAKMKVTKSALAIAKFAEKNEAHFFLDDEMFKTKNASLQLECDNLVSKLDDFLELQYQLGMEQKNRYE